MYIFQWARTNIKGFQKRIFQVSAFLAKIVFCIQALREWIGSCDAQSTLNLVLEKLRVYDSGMSDKCGATTEGAPFCESMDKKAIWKHQLCFAYRLNYEVFDFELKLINEKLLKIVALFSMPPTKMPYYEK